MKRSRHKAQRRILFILSLILGAFLAWPLLPYSQWWRVLFILITAIPFVVIDTTVGKFLLIGHIGPWALAITAVSAAIAYYYFGNMEAINQLSKLPNAAVILTVFQLSRMSKARS